MDRSVADYLLTRRSVTLPFLGEPGPDPRALRTILTIGARVPDHGKLAPWRLIVFSGDMRARAGELLAKIAGGRDPNLSAENLEQERNRFLPAPLTIGVVSTAKEHPKIPIVEQRHSAVNVCLNLLHGAHATGFAGHWVTRWFTYDAKASAALGASPHEAFVGFVHIGTPQIDPGDRDRPDLDELVTDWRPPAALPG
ncbi:MAG: nitroreductase [Alphaproteobacteria bacterium]|nr:nitroreductase [Alphaproteobacteria bacterium]